MSPVVVKKVVAYVTQRDRLLVFRHVASEAGIQVPAGTVEDGELPDDAVIREAGEETGLEGLEIRSFLGTRDQDMLPWGKVEIHSRHFYHIAYLGETTDCWRHFELTPSDSTRPIEFELFWVKFPDHVPELAAGLGDMLDRLP